MKTVILGAGGQLGYDLQRVLRDWNVYPFEHHELDICHEDQVEKVLTGVGPELVINAAAYGAVDECEKEVEKAFQINTFAVRHLARICNELRCKMLHISTDYVFDGTKGTPYSEDDLPNPLNVYGVSKLSGECFVRNVIPRHFVVRTSGLYGIAGSRGEGNNFVETMLQMAEEERSLRVVDDQILTPTYTKELASALRELIEKEAFGLYHITNQGECSWFEFAAEIFRLTNQDPELERISTQEYGAVAARPAYSVMSNQKIGEELGWKLSSWKNALFNYLQEKGHI